ncbi:hypothetical protein WICMUC_002137 [Wickerhamomyces mucosus]|uniref:Hcy-binding domain-containing protein n=1 Tax=Wickerhamomyces mucosus TaxID=1378264 RepID=A0A9P8PRJ2_9ASCO|nr:hypothetical protein WICMUC_002137 [Wickerhamomyces mucosus]
MEFTKFFDETPIIVLDGALGSQLPKEAQSHELWSTFALINNPEIIEKIHQDYIDSGADIILTSTYQMGESLIKRHYPNLDYEDIITKSIDIAYKVTSKIKESRNVYIAGSIGPYGASLANGAEYTGDYNGITREELIKFHEIRLKTLINDKRIDLLAIETIPNLLELKTLIEIMNDSYPQMKYYISLSVNKETLADGSTFQQIIQVINNNHKNNNINLLCIGVNCLGLKDSLNWLRKLSQVNDILKKPLVIYPNSGEIYDTTKREFIEDPNKDNKLNWEQYVGIVLENFPLVKIFGGCCRTTPETIRLIKKLAV